MTKKETKQPKPANIATWNIYQKLQAVQHQVGELEKDKLNKFQNYKYVAEYDIFRAIRPLLDDHNLVLTFSDEINLAAESTALPSLQAEKLEKEWAVKYLKKMILTNADNPTEQLTFHFWAPGQNTDIAKAKGSAETYSIKYFLLKFFLIPTSDDLDPDKGDKEEPVKPIIQPPKITEQQVQAIYDFFVKKRGNDLTIQTDFLSQMDKVMSNYNLVGKTNTGNYRLRLTTLTPPDYQSLWNYLDKLPDKE